MDSEEFKKYVDKNGIVTLKADKSSSAADDIKTLLTALGNTGGAIPFYAIFPADDPNSPITFDGILTNAGVIEKLKQAGPSKSHAGATTAETDVEGDRRTSRKNGSVAVKR